MMNKKPNTHVEFGFVLSIDASSRGFYELLRSQLMLKYFYSRVACLQ